MRLPKRRKFEALYEKLGENPEPDGVEMRGKLRKLRQREHLRHPFRNHQQRKEQHRED